MKENIDNNDRNSKNNIKNLMNYFNYNLKRDPISKIEKINNILLKKNKINLSLIYKEYINSLKIDPNINNDKNNENIIIMNDVKTNDNYYHDIINKNLLDIKNNTISFLDNIKNKIGFKYSQFSDFISNWLKKKDKKLTKILSGTVGCHLFFNYINENIFNKIKKIFEIHEIIFESIKDQFNLLNLFLEENNLIKCNCPMESFILKNSNFILNSWFLSKVNMESLCLSKIIENKDFSDLFKNYYSKKKEGILFKSIYLKDDKDKNYSYEPNISKDNFFKISKLKLKSISRDSLNKIYLKISNEKDFNLNENYNKIKSISLSNLDLFSLSVDSLNNLNFPILEKLKVKKCLMHYKCQYIFQSIISKTTNLKLIKIEKIKFTDKSLKDFITYISKNKSYLNTIQTISFKGNNLNSINFDNLVKNKLKFNNLEEFDVSNNNIYNFTTNNFRIFPKLIVLDLSNNNINNNLLFEGIRKSKSKNKINFIALMCKNIFLYNVDDNNRSYIEYLNENLINFNYKIKYINLSLLYNKDNRGELGQLFLSPIIKLSLIKLDLSYCGLNDIVFASFLRNNFDLINLTNLNLSNNFFTIKFFNLCLSINNNNIENENILLENIKNIDLSFNNIKYQINNDLVNFNKYLEKHCCLKKLKLQNNEILNIFKKDEEHDKYKNELEEMINLCAKRNIKIFIQSELCNSIEKDIFKNIFIFKNKFY